MGMFDMFKMLGKMNEVKESVNQVKEELKEIEVQGKDKDDIATVTLTGAKEVRSIELDPSALFPEKKELVEQALADAMSQAMQEASAKSKELIQKTISEKYPEIAGMDVAKFFG